MRLRQRVCGSPCSLPRHPFQSLLRTMVLPYRVATLLYCFKERDEVLLPERTQEPNRGFWSPCGGKSHIDQGESPYACACREAKEELGIALSTRDVRLTG